MARTELHTGKLLGSVFFMLQLNATIPETSSTFFTLNLVIMYSSPNFGFVK